MTGLPELPEGYFWRVSRDYPTSSLRYSYVRVEIIHHKKRRLLWDTYKTARANGWLMFEDMPWSEFEAEDIKAQKALIKGMALKVFRSFEKELDTLSRAAETESLLGDYPPKTLSDWPPCPEG